MWLEEPLEIPSILPSHGAQFHFLRISHRLRFVRNFFGPLLGDILHPNLPTALMWPFKSRLLLGDMWAEPTAKFMLIGFNDDDDDDAPLAFRAVYSIFSFIFGAATTAGLDVAWWQSLKKLVSTSSGHAQIEFGWSCLWTFWWSGEIAEVMLVSFFLVLAISNVRVGDKERWLSHIWMAYLRGAYVNEKTGLLWWRLEEKFLRRTKKTDAYSINK